MIFHDQSIDIYGSITTFEKEHILSSSQAVKRLSDQISEFIKEYYSFFTAYDYIKIYYDNGQTEVKKMLSKVFNAELQNVKVIKIIPTNYMLAQAADLVCTLKLTALKLESKALSSSEILVFDNERTLKKQYLNRLGYFSLQAIHIPAKNV